VSASSQPGCPAGRPLLVLHHGLLWRFDESRDSDGGGAVAVPALWREDTFLRRIERIYDAALVPERWSEFLEALADVIDGHVGNLAFTNPTLTHCGYCVPYFLICREPLGTMNSCQRRLQHSGRKSGIGRGACHRPAVAHAAIAHG
jgi:hypothetical protein